MNRLLLEARNWKPSPPRPMAADTRICGRRVAPCLRWLHMVPGMGIARGGWVCRAWNNTRARTFSARVVRGRMAVGHSCWTVPLSTAHPNLHRCYDILSRELDRKGGGARCAPHFPAHFTQQVPGFNPGLNGNRVQCPGCPRNGKQINPNQGSCMQEPATGVLRGPSRGVRKRWEGDRQAFGHLSARIPAC